MKEEFAARMLRVHFGEDDRWQGKPLHEAILARCRELGIAEAMAPRIRRGTYVLLPVSPDGHGHGTHTWAAFWQDRLAALLAMSEP